ncbi:divalent-cation tolerance protein CutA [Comamonas badia]|uniref:divalent-cation tolerance protein CutA n=1 Tax=Comamonas badia TaxID=265291 RepID=UPI0004166477|nr:divalent-cation tolerance protein CutA [Comamonas badia]
MGHLAGLHLITLVTTTVGSAEDAERLAGAAVARRLAACVQVLPVQSHYRWQGVLRHEAEWRLECKTVPERTGALIALLQRLHPYALPELVIHSLRADSAYAAWVAQETAPGD